jgi:hypothetical protein
MSLDADALRTSFELVVGRNPDLTLRFYDHLFALHPEARPLFHRSPREAQAKMLAEALAAVLDHLPGQYTPRGPGHDVPRPVLDDAPVRRLRHRGRVQPRYKFLLAQGGRPACRWPSTCRRRWATTATTRRRRRGRPVGVAIDSLEDMPGCSTASRSIRCRRR